MLALPWGVVVGPAPFHPGTWLDCSCWEAGVFGMAITVRGVCFSYGRKRVLHDVDWVVRRGVTACSGRTGRARQPCCRSLSDCCGRTRARLSRSSHAETTQA